VTVVREDGCRTDKHADTERGRFIDQGVVLDLRARADLYPNTDIGPAPDNDVLAEGRTLSDL
jgi:hypothetical protein